MFYILTTYDAKGELKQLTVGVGGTSFIDRTKKLSNLFLSSSLIRFVVSEEGLDIFFLELNYETKKKHCKIYTHNCTEKKRNTIVIFMVACNTQYQCTFILYKKEY